MAIFKDLNLNLEHKLLLQAALQEGEKAVTAWQKWITTVDIENLNDESYHLLPLLYRNLVKHQIEHPEMTRLKGVYRRNWYHNQLQVTKLTNILDLFTDAHLKTLVLGDLALATNYYPDLGMRPIHSIDLLVSADDAFQAFNLLHDLGWQAKVKLTPKIMALYPKIGLQDNSGQVLHLYWRFCGKSFSKNEILNYGFSSQIGEVSTYILKPEQQLLNICWQMVVNESLFLDRWLADSSYIICLDSPQIQGQELSQRAYDYSLIYQLDELINKLQLILNVQIKAELNLESAKFKVNTIEQIEKYLELLKKMSVYPQFKNKVLGYLRLADHYQFPLTIFGFIDYLKTTWNLDNSSKITYEIIRRSIKQFN